MDHCRSINLQSINFRYKRRNNIAGVCNTKLQVFCRQNGYTDTPIHRQADSSTPQKTIVLQRYNKLLTPAFLQLIASSFHVSHHGTEMHYSFNPLPDHKILDWSKLKQIADDILKCI